MWIKYGNLTVGIGSLEKGEWFEEHQGVTWGWLEIRNRHWSLKVWVEPQKKMKQKHKETFSTLGAMHCPEEAVAKIGLKEYTCWWPNTDSQCDQAGPASPLAPFIPWVDILQDSAHPTQAGRKGKEEDKWEEKMGTWLFPHLFSQETTLQPRALGPGPRHTRVCICYCNWFWFFTVLHNISMHILM